MLDMKGYGWMLWDGFQMTLLVGACSMILAIFMGLLGAWGKLSQSKVARLVAQTYTTVIRGIPELILLLLVFYGVPTLLQDLAAWMGYDLVIDLNSFLAGTLTLGFIYGAFCTEVFRGAFLAIPKGQKEACRAIGMHETLMFRRVLLPQAMRLALPGLGNVWMVLIKATALVSVIMLEELMRKAKIASGATHQPFTYYFAASLLFLLITVVSMWGQKKLEQRANRAYQR